MAADREGVLGQVWTDLTSHRFGLTSHTACMWPLSVSLAMPIAAYKCGRAHYHLGLPGPVAAVTEAQLS